MDEKVFEARTTPWATSEASIGFEASGVIIHSNAKSVEEDWDPPDVEVVRQVQDHRGVVPDIYAPGGYLLVSPAAQEGPVGDVLESTGEVLPVVGFDDADDRRNWAVYHCTTVVDVLDQDRSDISRFSDGRIMSVRSGVYRDLGDVDLPPIFRQAGLAGSLLFSEAGRQVVDDADVVGLEFVPAFQRSDPTAGRDAALTVDELSSLPPSRLDDRVWTRLVQLVDLNSPTALRSQDPEVAAYLSTRLFEWEVMNGGLHQYFFNYPDPDLLDVVLDGYDRLGLHEVRATIEATVAPIATREAEWRESLRDGRIETFFDSYGTTELNALDEHVQLFDHVRIERIRAQPDRFAR